MKKNIELFKDVYYELERALEYMLDEGLYKDDLGENSGKGFEKKQYFRSNYMLVKRALEMVRDKYCEKLIYPCKKRREAGDCGSCLYRTGHFDLRLAVTFAGGWLSRMHGSDEIIIPIPLDELSNPVQKFKVPGKNPIENMKCKRVLFHGYVVRHAKHGIVGAGGTLLEAWRMARDFFDNLS